MSSKIYKINKKHYLNINRHSEDSINTTVSSNLATAIRKSIRYMSNASETSLQYLQPRFTFLAEDQSERNNGDDCFAMIHYNSHHPERNNYVNTQQERDGEEIIINITI